MQLVADRSYVPTYNKQMNLINKTKYVINPLLILLQQQNINANLDELNLLTSISLSSLTNLQLTELLDRLNKHDTLNLIILELTNCELSNDNVVILNIIIGKSKNLKTLKLSEGNLTLEQLNELTNLINHQSIETLNLFSNNIYKSEEINIISDLLKNKNLKTLDIGDNYFSKSDFLIISNSLRNNKTLTKLNLGAYDNSNGLENILRALPFTVVSSINLEKNRFQDYNIILETLKPITTLTSLNLMDTRIDNNIAKNIADLLKSNIPPLKQLNLSKNVFGYTGIIDLAKSLITNTTLTELDIMHNNPVAITELQVALALGSVRGVQNHLAIARVQAVDAQAAHAAQAAQATQVAQAAQAAQTRAVQAAQVEQATQAAQAAQAAQATQAAQAAQAAQAELVIARAQARLAAQVAQEAQEAQAHLEVRAIEVVQAAQAVQAAQTAHTAAQAAEQATEDAVAVLTELATALSINKTLIRLKINFPLPLNWDQLMNITDETFIILMKRLVNVHFTVPQQLGNDGMRIFGNKLDKSLNENNQLEELSIFSEECMIKYIINFLNKNRTLTKLSLSKNSDNSDNFTKLVEVLLPISWKSIFPTLNTLKLIKYQFNGTNTSKFGELLMTNKVLTTLSLIDCNIDQKGVEILTKNLNSWYLTTFNFENSNISDSLIIPFASALGKKNAKLKTLSFSNNNITDTGATHLAKALESNNVLTSLSLNNNKITYNGALKLVNALQNNSTLRDLYISDNSIINYLEKDQLKKIVKQNTTLYKFYCF